MINNPEPDTEPQPLPLDLLAVDFMHQPDLYGADSITVRLHDRSGLRIDLPMERAKAELFGLSLADYAATE